MTVVIWISLMTMLSGFSCAYFHLYIFFEEMPVQIFCSFFELGCFLGLSHRDSVYIMDINPLPGIWFANIFFHFVGSNFTLLIVSLEAQNFPIWWFFNLWVFSFVASAFGIIFKNSLAIWMSWRYSPMFSPKSFVVLALILGLWSILS